MGRTIGEILDYLEKPENEGEIQHLVHLKHIKNVEGLKSIGGFTGIISGFALRFAKKHMDAFMLLSECISTDDITAFKQTQYYKKIKNTEVGSDLNLEDLAKLEGLKELEDNLE